jgi:ABC-type antimicrobial peptide transport system permease subunit
VGAQIGAGVVAGLALAALLERMSPGAATDHAPIVFPLVAVVMASVGLLAALGPARRGLAVQPTDALRND